MKIAILTHPIMFNYGGILQNFALQTVLRKHGYDVVTLNRLPDFDYSISIQNVLNYLNRLVHKFILHQDVCTRWNPNLTQEKFDFLSQNLRSFIERNIVLTPSITNSQIASFVKDEKYDAYIVGSDQVWIPSYAKQSFIDFDRRETVIKIAYAASCGNRSWMDDDHLISECSVLAKDFKALSTREPEIARRASDILHREVHWVLDPTLLLRKEDYLSAISPNTEKEHFIFAYILDETPEKAHVINDLADKMGVIVRYSTIDNNIPGRSIDWWINSLNNADFVITDSFHGTALSIVFEKQFCVFGNEKRGNARFESILNIANLSDRILSDSCNCDYQIKHLVDYDMVKSHFEIKRKESINFLMENLV